MRLLDGVEPGRALDVPCGTGLLARELAARGHVVRGLDLDVGPARAAGIDATAGDMETALPFAASSFDLVACLEGIEHIENQRSFLMEVARVLAPKGRLVISTPNVLGHPSRSSLARKGYARFFRPLPAGSPTPYEHAHRHPIDLVRLEHLLAEAGLSIEAFDGDAGPDGGARRLRRLRLRFATRSIARHNPRADLLLHPAVFHSRVIVLRARKA